jgi:hypothetical protein
MVQRRKTVDGVRDTGLRFTMDQGGGTGTNPHRRNSIRDDIKRKLTLHTP